MSPSYLIKALVLVSLVVSSLAACGSQPQNLANPSVRGDRSSIQGDANATALQRQEQE